MDTPKIDMQAAYGALKAEAGQLVGNLLDAMATKDAIIGVQAQRIAELEELQQLDE